MAKTMESLQVRADFTRMYVLANDETLPRAHGRIYLCKVTPNPAVPLTKALKILPNVMLLHAIYAISAIVAKLSCPHLVDAPFGKIVGADYGSQGQSDVLSRRPWSSTRNLRA